MATRKRRRKRDIEKNYPRRQFIAKLRRLADCLEDEERFRIQVAGDPDLLKRESVADTIRAELLAGVRFAWLWQQLGGRRWHLVLRRRQLLVALETLERKT